MELYCVTISHNSHSYTIISREYYIGRTTMSFNTSDSLRLSQLQSALPPPPQYTAATAQRDVKTVDNYGYSHSPWLLRRTSIHVESTPNEGRQDDSSSHREVAPSIRSNDEKIALRNLVTRFGNKLAEVPSEDRRVDRDAALPHDSSNFGTRVFIEAAPPLKPQTRERHEMKGLEQAASVKRWPGNGDPAEPWGKLTKVNLCANFVNDDARSSNI